MLLIWDSNASLPPPMADEGRGDGVIGNEVTGANPSFAATSEQTLLHS
ncbi:MAG: hypothetical protein WDA65_08220 [Christensenellales bacterium]